MRWNEREVAVSVLVRLQVHYESVADRSIRNQNAEEQNGRAPTPVDTFEPIEEIRRLSTFGLFLLRLGIYCGYEVRHTAIQSPINRIFIVPYVLNRFLVREFRIPKLYCVAAMAMATATTKTIRLLFVNGNRSNYSILDANAVAANVERIKIDE